jgi:hypothetical protein
MVGQSPPVIAAAAVALVVAFGGIGWTVASRSGAQAPEVVALTAAGLAGAVLVGLLPSDSDEGAGELIEMCPPSGRPMEMSVSGRWTEHLVAGIVTCNEGGHGWPTLTRGGASVRTGSGCARRACGRCRSGYQMLTPRASPRRHTGNRAR